MGVIRRGPGEGVIQDVRQMSRRSPQVSTFSMGRARSRALGLFSAGAVVIGVLGAVPSATAAPANNDQAATKQLPSRTLGAGRYVVLLREPGATQYDGG